MNNNAIHVLKSRYLGENETPEDMYRRVANIIAEVDFAKDPVELSDEFYEMMADLDFLPNSPKTRNVADPVAFPCPRPSHWSSRKWPGWG